MAHASLRNGFWLSTADASSSIGRDEEQRETEDQVYGEKAVRLRASQTGRRLPPEP